MILSSNGHRVGGFAIDDLGSERRPYDHWMAYSQSKMANVLFAVGLARRVAPFGITANAIHPGVIRTEVFRNVTPDEEKMVTGWSEMNGSPVKSAAQGAATQVWAALAPELATTSGVYLEDCKIAAVNADPAIPDGCFAPALDPATADRLWTISEDIVGQRFAY